MGARLQGGHRCSNQPCARQRLPLLSRVRRSRSNRRKATTPLRPARAHLLRRPVLKAVHLDGAVIRRADIRTKTVRGGAGSDGMKGDAMVMMTVRAAGTSAALADRARA